MEGVRSQSILIPDIVINKPNFVNIRSDIKIRLNYRTFYQFIYFLEQNGYPCIWKLFFGVQLCHGYNKVNLTQTSDGLIWKSINETIFLCDLRYFLKELLKSFKSLLHLFGSSFNMQFYCKTLVKIKLNNLL